MSHDLDIQEQMQNMKNSIWNWVTLILQNCHIYLSQSPYISYIFTPLGFEWTNHLTLYPWPSSILLLTPWTFLYHFNTYRGMLLLYAKTHCVISSFESSNIHCIQNSEFKYKIIDWSVCRCWTDTTISLYMMQHFLFSTCGSHVSLW